MNTNFFTGLINSVGKAVILDRIYLNNSHFWVSKICG